MSDDLVARARALRAQAERLTAELESLTAAMAALEKEVCPAGPDDYENPIGIIDAWPIVHETGCLLDRAFEKWSTHHHGERA